MHAGELKEVLRLVIREPRKYPPIFVWGGPGIGKTSITYEVAVEEGATAIETPPAVTTDPTDWRGIPIPEEGRAKWLAPNFLPKDNGERTVMFLDEINVAAPLVQNTLLQLIIPPHRLGDYKLPELCAVIAAGNRESEAYVHRMSPPLLNRFIHIDLDISNAEWTKWAIRNNVNPMVIGLVGENGFRQELLYKFEPQKKAYPTPRTWEFTSKVLNNGAPENLKFELIKGCVGEGAAIELDTYIKVWNELPDLDKILAGQDNTIPESIDLMYACVIGLVSKAQKPAHYNRLLEYGLMLQREFSIFLVKLLYNKDSKTLVKADNWYEFSKTIVADEGLLS